MTSFKHLPLIALALASGIASAANQPFTATSGTVTLDTSFVTSNGYVASALGAATYDAGTGTLTDPVQGVSTSTEPGPIVIDFSDTSGLSIKKNYTNVKLTDFTFDVATNTLFGDVNVGVLLSLNDQALLTASSVSSSLGTDVGTSVTSSATTVTIGMARSIGTMAVAPRICGRCSLEACVAISTEGTSPYREYGLRSLGAMLIWATLPTVRSIRKTASPPISALMNTKTNTPTATPSTSSAVCARLAVR